jgi:hypothetical protein
MGTIDPSFHITSAKGFIVMARNPAFVKQERYSFLVFAHMHACQAETGDTSPYSDAVHDYKHAIGKCIESIMNGVHIDQALGDLPDFDPDKEL